MTTIAIKEETKRELLKFVSELQIKLGRRVDFDEAIKFLLFSRRKKNPELLLKATIKGVDAKKALDELRKERRADEERIKRRYGV
ncbi:MAG: hypothetical protein ACP6IU_10965 [Candidatus Asgardarchaeia archaeon]